MKHHLPQGFTLIEMVVTLAIIVVVFSIAIARTDRVNSGTSLKITSDVMISDLRATAMSALNNEQFQLQATTGWGVQIESDTNPTSYTIFADLNNDLAYSTNEKFKTVNLTKDIKLHCTSFNGECYTKGALIFKNTTAKTYFAGKEISNETGKVFVGLEDMISSEIKYIPINRIGVINPEEHLRQ